tara:strand:- start:340 stop:621 length:282 start_codon:yes stop_codon:yes gene_type:complete
MIFGKNPSGQLIDDPTTNQAFSTVEKDMAVLEERVKVLEEFVDRLPKQVETAMSLISNPTASTFDSAGVTAINVAVVKLVDALNDLSNRVKKL